MYYDVFLVGKKKGWSYCGMEYGSCPSAFVQYVTIFGRRSYAITRELVTASGALENNLNDFILLYFISHSHIIDSSIISRL